MNKILGVLKDYGASVLQGLIGVVLVLGLGFGLVLLVQALLKLADSQIVVTSLPLLAIGGVVMLILVLTIVAVIFWILGLTEKGQAIGIAGGVDPGGHRALPYRSVRDPRRLPL